MHGIARSSRRSSLTRASDKRSLAAWIDSLHGRTDATSVRAATAPLIFMTGRADEAPLTERCFLRRTRPIATEPSAATAPCGAAPATQRSSRPPWRSRWPAGRAHRLRAGLRRHPADTRPAEARGMADPHPAAGSAVSLSEPGEAEPLGRRVARVAQVAAAAGAAARQLPGARLAKSAVAGTPARAWAGKRLPAARAAMAESRAGAVQAQAALQVVWEAPRVSPVVRGAGA